MNTRPGAHVSLAALSGGRSKRLAALKQLEHALRTDGWARIVHDALSQPTTEMYHAAMPLFADADACHSHQRDALDGSLACTYLAMDEEPLYDHDASQQYVHSWNTHEELLAAECDERLGG